MITLNDFFIKFTKIIEFRHLNTHKGHYQDKEMDEIDLLFGVTLSKLERESFNLEEKCGERIPKRVSEYFVRQHRSKKHRQVDEVICHVNESLKLFLESLNPPFLDRLSRE